MQQTANDLDPLPFPCRQIPDDTEGIKRQPVFFRDAPDTGGDTSTKRRTLTRDEFFDELKNSGTGPQGIDIARRMYEDFDADKRFTIDWKASSYVVKLQGHIEKFAAEVYARRRAAET